MQCTSPRTAPGGITVPCGKCLGCRMAHNREWSIRILHEMESWDYSSFVTLTYAPDYLPIDNELVKAHLQLFIKRLRQSMLPRKLKYFACGEYGKLMGRPHYHLIIFGIGPKEDELIREAWPNGFIYMGTVTFESAQYVTGYIYDKISGQIAASFGHKVKPFQLCSQGMGKEWLMKNKEDVLYNFGVRHRGKIMSMPRYYTKLLGEEILDDDKNQRVLAKGAESDAWREERQIDLRNAVKLEDGRRETRKAENEFRLARKSSKL